MLDTTAIRSHFPSLATDAIYFDNPGGTQVARETMERMQQYFLHANANHGGSFRTSRASDTLVAQARQAVADFLNAARPEEIVFGQNMTSLTLHISRSIARTLNAGDEIIVTRLDHDANIAPWLLIAEDRGCTIRWVDIHAEDCTLAMEQMEQMISPCTKVVAVGYASNAVGTINDVRRAVELAHSVGAICFVDAVQYAPHRPIDVQALDCDFLVCSAYKFFGPHIGILYGKYAHLDTLTAYKVRPAGAEPPDKFETGTLSFEAITATLGTMEYLAWLGTTSGAEFKEHYQERYQGRTLALKQAMATITANELDINQKLLQAFTSIRGLHLYGITDPRRMYERVSTFSFTLDGYTPQAVASALDQANIYVWDGDFYAVSVIERLGLQAQGGLVRVGLVHYNTLDEIEKMRIALDTLVG